jgi:hypothetical protein
LSKGSKGACSVRCRYTTRWLRNPHQLHLLSCPSLSTIKPARRNPGGPFCLSLSC